MLFVHKKIFKYKKNVGRQAFFFWCISYLRLDPAWFDCTCRCFCSMNSSSGWDVSISALTESTVYRKSACDEQTLLTPILAQTDTRKALRWVYLPLQRYHSICLSLHSHNNQSSPGPSGHIALSDMWSICSSVDGEQMISTDGNEDILLFCNQRQDNSWCKSTSSRSN